MRITRRGLAGGAAIAAGAAVGPPAPAQPPPAAPDGGASAATRAAQARARTALPPEDGADFARARRGFLAALPEPVTIPGPGPRSAWDLSGYAFLPPGEADDAPPTVHPSLWRAAKLNAIHGLFEVADGIWQVRGYDLSVMSVVRSETGWIVVDPLTSAETARAAWQGLVLPRLGDRPVSAIVYTHSHIDHYGGVLGVVGREEAAARRVPVLAPAGFLEAAADENVIAGNAMSRRAGHMYGSLLPRGPEGQVDAGIGKAVSAGRPGLIAPTLHAERTGQRLALDGVELVALMAPESEAPAEFMFWLPRHRAFCAAEDALHTMHNLYSPRGAKYRSGLKWSKYLQQALELWGGEIEVLFGSHQWPVWGNAECAAHLETQRDLYRAMHDQALRLANHGLAAAEVAERIRLPAALEREWSARGVYGTLKHNARAQVEMHLGWYSGNPAPLDRLPPSQSAANYVAFMGGGAALIEKARKSFDEGDYRWVVEVVDHLVTAEPGNEAARALLAAAYEQLGFQAESAPWRNIYLSGALELRRGPPAPPPRPRVAAQLAPLAVEQVLDWLGVRLDAGKAADARLTLNFALEPEPWVVGVRNGALHASAGRQAARADATLRLGRAAFDALCSGERAPGELVRAGLLAIDGDASKLDEFLALLDRFPPGFDLVPRRPA
jgi:alkyl sulfatase BDS1-like metallo-beta-lactamase superfamily hydrolase